MHHKFKYVLAAALLISGTATAQQNPFPQERQYLNCIKPVVEQSHMNAQVAEAYDYLKSRFFKQIEQPGSTQYYVETHNDYHYDQVVTTSKIHAMAMNIVVQMAGYDPDAQKLFDGLVAFYENHITEYQGPNLMQMYVYKHDVYPTDGPQTLEYKNYFSNSAADIEIAMALYYAYKQWGDITYKNKAQTVINDIKEYEINPETQAIRLRTESYYMDSETYLYTSPASWNSNAFKTFADITAEVSWDRIADQNYEIYNTFKNSKANWYGLIPDYLYFDGTETQIPPAGFLISEGVTNPQHYGEEAVLFPLHAAFDYAFNKDRNAKAVLEDTERFIVNSIESITYQSVKKGYTLEGEPLSDTAGSLRYIAPLTASLIAGTNKEALTKAWNAMVTTTPRAEIEAALKVKAMLLISGNWFNFDSYWPNDEYDTLELTIDDFADDKLIQSKIGAEYSAFHNFDAGSNWYITIPTDSGKVLCTNGTEVDTDSPTTLFHSDSKTMEGTIQGSAEITLDFPNGAEYNLFDMDAALLRLKGSGKLQITFTSNDDIQADPGDFRGGFTCNFDLQEEWKETRVDANLLTPEPYSVEHFNALMWDDVAHRATGITLSSADSSEVTFSLDWIKLLGKDITTQTFEYKTGSVNLSQQVKTAANKLSSIIASSGVVRAELGLLKDETVDISIISLNGKTLYRQSHQLNRGANGLNINMNSLAKGIYFMKVNGSSINQVQKFILQ